MSFYNAVDGDLHIEFCDAVLRTLKKRRARLSDTSKKSLFNVRGGKAEFGFEAKEIQLELMALFDASLEQAQARLNSFLGAHLLHAAGNRALTRNPGKNLELQPTAKGFAYMEELYKVTKTDLDDDSREIMERVIASSHTTMSLVRLERSLLKNSLQISMGMAMVLWTRMLGEKPQFVDAALASTHTISLEKVVHFDRTMLHPNSRNLMQYWTSDGLRMFSSLRFEKRAGSRFASTREYTIKCVISGRSILQWIMDCTTVANREEGIRVAKLLLANGFVKRILDLPVDALAGVSADLYSGSKDQGFNFSSNSLYRLTPRGARFCLWEHLLDESALDDEDVQKECARAEARLNDDVSSCAGDKWAWEHQALPELDATFGQVIDIKLIQQEPGLKMLFREELDSFNISEVFQFVDISQQTLLLLKAAFDCRETVTRRKQLDREARCLLVRMCESFVKVGAPFELNLSERDRDAFLKAAGSKDLNVVVRPLTVIKQRCLDLLQDAIMSFKEGERARAIPMLRTFVVARYVRGQALQMPSVQCDVKEATPSRAAATC